MQEILGSQPLVFLILTLVIFGWFALMMGQVLAANWRPMWQIVPYALLLAATNRFFSYALFGGELLSLTGFAVDALVLGGIAWFAYAVRRARKMVSQYPWLYEPDGLFGWRDRQGRS